MTDDSCPETFSGPDLAAQLATTGRSLVGYSEDLPRPGCTGCGTADHAREHNPWVDFTALPAAVNQPCSALTTDFSGLPTVSFVVPNLGDDMHDCDVATGDAWAEQHLSAYVAWAQGHDSLLVLTFDEDDGSQANRIATVLVGPLVTPGAYDQRIDHDSLLRTLEDMYRLPRIGKAVDAVPLRAIWRGAPG